MTRIILALLAVSFIAAQAPAKNPQRLAFSGYRTGEVRFFKTVPTQAGVYHAPTAANLVPLESGFTYGRNFAIVTNQKRVFALSGRTVIVEQNGDGGLTVFDLK